MANFDPAAATAAHLSAMSPAALAKAVDYTHQQHWLLLGATLVSIVVAWIILKTGVMRRLQASLEAGKPRPILTSLILPFVYLVIASVLSLPWVAYADWWFEKSFAMTSQSFVGWFDEHMIKTAIGWVTGAIFFWAVYAVIRRARRTWWLWGGVVVALFAGAFLILEPIFIEPIFNKYTPAPPGPMREAVVAMAKANHVPSDKIYIYNGSKQSNRYTANVSGLFGAARVAMSDTMTAKGADIAEVRGVLGHEMGHYVHQHGLILMAALGVMAAALFWVIGALFPLFAGLLGAKGVTGIADPAGFPVLMATFAVAHLLFTPIQNSLTRFTEADADAFSMVASHEPDGLSKALVKTADYRAPSPSQLEEFVFYDHPSVSHRVRAAMDWKAANLALAEKTAADDAALEAQVKAAAAAAPAPAAKASATKKAPDKP
jgi:STE24 endopeptidase